MEDSALKRLSPPAQRSAAPRLPAPIWHLLTVVLAGVGAAVSQGIAHGPPPRRAPAPAVTVSVFSARPLDLPSSRPTAIDPVDSNSPAVWTIDEGVPTLHVFTSIDGYPSHAWGPSLDDLGPAVPIRWDPAPPPGGVWLEAVVADVDGTLYGYYHNEVSPPGCPSSTRMEPRIGAARSSDGGHTWTDLGLILMAPPGTATCGTTNKFFTGGVGDFSVMLDRDARYLYLFFSQYVGEAPQQGVAVARMPWAVRDRPAGHLAVWQGRIWLPTDPDPPRPGAEDGDEPVVYRLAAPVFPAADSWHDGATSDAFWGPSVHWNAHVDCYVMLLNRTRSVSWDQEGIYVSFAAGLDDPRGWTQPRRIVTGGRWYPQVFGLEPGEGTDKLAGPVARFFMGGRSNYLIAFERQ